MANPYFQFKQFTVYHDRCSMKVTTDACLFGAWVAHELHAASSPKYEILDIGSGSGLLSLMLAQSINGHIEGIELQDSDYLQSLENVAQSPYAERIQIFKGDTLTFPYAKKYDVVISNPPFYEKDLRSDSSGKNIAHHDDGLKLDALVKLIQKVLQPSGTFYLLFPAKRIQEIKREIAISHLCINKMVSVRQTEKHTHFRFLLKGSFYETPLQQEEIVIKTDNNYTDAFVRLLQPYYLYL